MRFFVVVAVVVVVVVVVVVLVLLLPLLFSLCHVHLRMWSFACGMPLTGDNIAAIETEIDAGPTYTYE